MKAQSAMKSSDQKVIVSIPENKGLKKLIDTTAEYVATDGEMFEQVFPI